MTDDDRRAIADAKGDIQAQEALIAKWMTERRWRKKLKPYLAEQWGLGLRTVGERAKAASRAAQLVMGGKVEFVAEAMAELDNVIQIALDSVAMITDKETGEINYAKCPELKTVVAAVRVQAEIMGAIGARAAQKEKGDDPTPEEYAKMTSKEKIEAHKRAIAEEEAKLEGRH